MSNIGEKIEVLQAWINEIRQKQAAEPLEISANEAVLSDVFNRIQQGIAQEQGITETYDVLEREIQHQPAILTGATDALKTQVAAHEASAIQLRIAYNNLESGLQAFIADHSRLNQLLQEQFRAYKSVQALEKEERALTDAIRDTLATMSSTLDLDKILDHILDTVGRVTPYDGANVLLVESDLVHVVRQRGYVEKEQERDWLNQRIPVSKLAILQQLMDIGKPLAIADTTTSPMWIGFPGLDWVNSNVIAPIRSNGKILGFLSLDSATAGYFTQSHAELLQTFADQAAIAIQNARLRDRAKHAAVMAERNRLANELHDTISQTLWSISLITERIPAIWDVDQEEGRKSLNTLHDLAQNALAEMRTLLLELHPSSLTDTKLGDAIRQVAEIIASRTGLDIAVRVEKQETVPPDVHFALYRAVQEALNNIVRHALASRVEIYLNSDSGHVDLTIRDNGQGFDPNNVVPSHLGLNIMRDRIHNIDGNVEVISNKADGTMIKIHWAEPVE